MIRYQLACEAGHGFESWFRDSAAYDDQAALGFLTCPVCNSGTVGKALMAPGVVTDRAAAQASSSAPSQPALPAARPRALVSPEEQALRGKLRELRAHLVRNSDDVGTGFAAEARKMHDGETEHRAIHGQASPEEARALMEDGIPVHALPILPEDRN